MRVLRIPLVWHNLLHDRRRAAVGCLGVAFSAILMFMQLGFLGAVRTTARTVLEVLDFDILLVSPAYLYLYDSGSFPRQRLEQARSAPGVSAAIPLYVGFNMWSRHTVDASDAAMPAAGEAGTGGVEGPVPQRAIFVLGHHLADRPFRRDRLEGLRLRVRSRGDGACLDVVSPRDLAALKEPDAVLFDRLSHRDFGPLDRLDPCFEGPLPVTDRVEDGPRRIFVGPREVAIVGGFNLATGFGADGAILVNDQNFSRLFGGRSLDEVSLGLVRASGDPEAVAADLRRLLPDDDVRVLTRGAILDQETRYWVREKPIGVIFGVGLGVACAVGVVFVYQILSSDITNRFGEFATLKAMGFPDRTISLLVVKQALILAHAGFLPGWLISAGLDRLIGQAIRMPLTILPQDAVSVYIATTTMCMLSAVLSVGKVRRADPADLFA